MDQQPIGMGKKKRARYEWLVMLLVIAVASAIGMGVYNKRAAVEKADLLQNQLSQLRTAVTVYKTLNKANPPALSSLVNETLNFSDPAAQPQPYVTNMHVDNAGNIVDPFGHEYQYDAATGWVASTTEGYQNW